MNTEMLEIVKMLDKEEHTEKKISEMQTMMNEAQSESVRRIKIKYPGLTASDLKMCVYLKMKLSTKEIAQLTNLSVRGIEASRYRIRKKLQISSSTDMSEFLGSI
jgi:DNA-binding CsgD family transcriptional regulator